MAGKQYKDYTIRTEYDGSKALKDYEKYLKDKKTLEKKYGTGGGGTGRGSSGGGRRGKTLTDEEKKIKAQKQLDKENHRIWGLRQQGEQRRERESARREATRVRAEENSRKQERARERERLQNENNLHRDAQRSENQRYKDYWDQQAARQRRARQEERELRQAQSRQRREQRAAAREAQAQARRNIPGRRQQGLANRMDFQIGRLSSVADTPGMNSAPIQAQISQLRALRAQLNAVRSSNAIDRIGNDYREARNNAEALVRSQRRVNAQLNLGQQAGQRFSQSIRSAGMQLASFYAIAGAGKAIFKTGKELDSMQASLLAASGGAQAAGENFEFLKKTSFSLGKDLTTMVGGFNRLGVAARSAGLADSEIKEVFLGAAESATTFGLDTQRSSLVMLAMAQMVSKGKVSMQEMSQQMGESMPIAMEAGARAIGKTTAEFIKLVSTGKVLSKDFILPFARQLRMMVREDGALAAAKKKLTAEQQRMNAAFQIMIHSMFQEGGLAKSLSKAFAALGSTISAMTPVITDVVRVLTTMGEMIGGLVGVVFELGYAFVSLGSSGEHSAGVVRRAWSGILSIFYSVTSAIYGVIAAMEDLKSYGSWDGFWAKNAELRKQNDASGVPAIARLHGAFGESIYQSVFGDDKSSGGGTTLNVDTINVQSDNAMDMMNDLETMAFD